VGYYRGDGTNYYRGDYYRGDPFLGAIGALAGRAVGRLAAKAGQWVGRQVAGRGAQTIKQIAGQAIPGTIAGTIGVAIGRNSPSMPTLGPIAESIPFIGAARKRRRINPLNPKALRRALRRAEGFEKFSKRTVNALYKTIDGRRVRTFKKKTGSS